MKVALGKRCTIIVVYGVTDEQFRHHKLTLGEVEEKYRNWSKKISRGQTNTAKKPVTSSIAESLKVWKSLTKQSNNRRNADASVSYERE